MYEDSSNFFQHGQQTVILEIFTEMVNNKLKTYFSSTTLLLDSLHKRAKRNIQHSGLKGYDKEFFVRHFLRDLFPIKFVLGRGEIIDSHEGSSGECDLIVYREDYPSLFFGGEARQFLAEGVLANIEVKSSLDLNELKREIYGERDIGGKAVKLKRLDKIQPRTMVAFQVGPIKEYFLSSPKVPNVLFTYESSIKQSSLAAELERAKTSLNNYYPFDCICSLKKFVVYHDPIEGKLRFVEDNVLLSLFIYLFNLMQAINRSDPDLNLYINS